MAVDTGRSSGPDQSGKTADPEKKTSCACDCQSYAPAVARRYADDHIRYPDWFGKGGTDIKVEILNTHCQFLADGPPCTSVATVEAVDENGDKLIIVIMLYGESMFYVWTDKQYPVGCYSFRCAGPGESGMTLIPVQCPTRKSGQGDG